MRYSSFGAESLCVGSGGGEEARRRRRRRRRREDKNIIFYYRWRNSEAGKVGHGEKGTRREQ